MFIAVLIGILSAGAAEARDVKSEILTPKYQGRPIVALLSSELTEPPLNQLNYQLARAAAVCEFLRAPSGSFRSRRAENLLTQGFTHDGKLALIQKLSGGSVHASLVDSAATDHPEVIKSLRCVGTN